MIKPFLNFKKKKFSKSLENFTLTYPFFKIFNSDKLIKLFNSFKQKIVYKGDYLFHQNEEGGFIYFINNGIFSVYSFISFFWLDDYIDYLDYSSNNILQYLIKERKLKFSEIESTIEKLQKKTISSPIKEENYELLEKLNSKLKNDNIYFLKEDEEKLNDPKKIFKINLKRIDSPEILGLEESFELKRRFFSVKCISEKAEVKYIKIEQLFELLLNLNKNDLDYLIKYIKDRKNIIKSRLINGINNLENNLKFNFDIRYENLIKSTENIKKENKKNILVTAIKMKGYNSNIQDLLDKDIPQLQNTERNNQKHLSKKNLQKILKDIYKKKNKKNEFKFKKIEHNPYLSQLYKDKWSDSLSSMQNNSYNMVIIGEKNKINCDNSYMSQIINYNRFSVSPLKTGRYNSVKSLEKSNFDPNENISSNQSNIENKERNSKLVKTKLNGNKIDINCFTKRNEKDNKNSYLDINNSLPISLGQSLLSAYKFSSPYKIRSKLFKKIRGISESPEKNRDEENKQNKGIKNNNISYQNILPFLCFSNFNVNNKKRFFLGKKLN